MVAILDVFGKAYFTNRARPIIYPREPNFDVSGVHCQDDVPIDENHVCQALHVSGDSSDNRLLKGYWRISGLATFRIFYTPKMLLASQDKPMKRFGY